MNIVFNFLVVNKGEGERFGWPGEKGEEKMRSERGGDVIRVWRPA